MRPTGPGRALRLAVTAAAALAAAACANPRAEQAALAPALFVGMPKQTLLSCAGVPERTASLDNMEFYTYTSSRTTAYGSPGVGFYGARHWPGYGFGLGFPGYYDGYDIRSTTCEATFTLRNGVVERLVYGGDASAGTSRLGQCYAIVENCLAIVPRPAAPPAGAQPEATPGGRPG